MNRKLLIRVTAPAVLISLVLFAACLVSAWYISRLQRDLAKVLSREVISLQAAQELEIRVQQLRFHTFLNLIDPAHARKAPLEQVQQYVRDALDRARSSAYRPEERAAVREIEAGYQRYQRELAQLSTELERSGAPADLHQLADAHPVRHVVDPCRKLLNLNKDMMQQTAAESDRMSRQGRLFLFILGLVGPVSGLIGGFGIARGLSRSIYQLGVRVHGMAQRLDQPVASVIIPAGGDLQHLDQQLQQVVQRVEEVVQDWQRQQQEMVRAEQLSAVGKLAASVAHEVRNPLTSVKLLVEAALRPRNRKPLTDEDLSVIHGEVVRLEQTVQGFLDFARPPAPQRTTCDVRQVVTQAAELVRARARQQGVTLDVSCPTQPLAADLDRGQWRTVLVNLLINALDAMPTGGRLEVALTLTPAAEALLTVSDTGGGIAPEMRDRLFTPFASTKPTGTGLGLSISRRIVEEHGGRITAVNRAEGGARFSITLALAQAEERGRTANSFPA
jgi:signal transduction histidine kinase